MTVLYSFPYMPHFPLQYGHSPHSLPHPPTAGTCAPDTGWGCNGQQVGRSRPTRSGFPASTSVHVGGAATASVTLVTPGQTLVFSTALQDHNLHSHGSDTRGEVHALELHCGSQQVTPTGQ